MCLESDAHRRLLAIILIEHLPRSAQLDTISVLKLFSER